MIGEATIMRESKYTDWDRVPLFLTVIEAAELLAVHRNTVMNQIRSGRLQAHKIGREWRISKDAILEMLREGE